MSALALLIIQELPSIIDAIKAKHAAANPSAPPITNDEAIAALHEAVRATLSIDDAWDALHPLKQD